MDGFFAKDNPLQKNSKKFFPFFKTFFLQNSIKEKIFKII